MESVMKAMSPQNYHIDMGGLDVVLSDSIITMWLVTAVIIILAYVFTQNLKTVPEGSQNIVEGLVGFINNFVKDIAGHHWKHFAPYIGTVLIFLVGCNMVSIFSIIPTGHQLYALTGMEIFEHLPEFEIRPPTKDLNVTVTMAFMTIMLVLGSSIRFKGVPGWLKGLARPTPIMIPFNIMDYGTRLMSLSLRLFGNILAAFLVMELIYSVAAPVVPAIFSLYFDLFDSILQAYIFVFLSTIYIAEAVE